MNTDYVKLAEDALYELEPLQRKAVEIMYRGLWAQRRFSIILGNALHEGMFATIYFLTYPLFSIIHAAVWAIQWAWSDSGT
jgi:hypothetical protein